MLLIGVWLLGGTTNAALIRVVGPTRYAEAESVNQGRDAAVNTAGSPLGAVLFGISRAFPFFASAIFDALAFVCAWFLRLPNMQEEDAQNGANNGIPNRGMLSFWSDMVDGWRWVLASKTIVSAVVVIGIVQFSVFGLHQAVNLSLVERGTEPLLISLSNVGMAVGTILGSVFSTRVCNRIPTGKGVVIVFFAMAVAYLPMVLSASYPVIIASTCLASFPMPLFNALVSGFVFSKTPVSKQGRTRAAVMTVLMFFASFSGAVAGELLPRIGLSGFVLVMVGLAVLGAAVAALNPLLRAIPAAPEWEHVEL